MRVNARMIIKAAVRMEQRALRASQEAKEAEDTARKADRKADKAAQKAYKVRKAANKQMVGALQCLQSKPEDWEEYDIHDWDWSGRIDFLGLRKKRMRLTD